MLAIQLGREAGAEPVVHCGHEGEGKLLVERMPPTEPVLAMYLRRAHADVQVVGDVLGALPEEDPIQVMFGGSIERMDPLLAALSSGVEASDRPGCGSRARLERTVYPEHGVEIIDVLSPGVGKAEAMRFVCSRLGLTPADALAIGDNWNDAQMLLEAGRGLVMGNADEGLHRLGLEVLPSNDEDGVAVGIDRHLFGEWKKGVIAHPSRSRRSFYFFFFAAFFLVAFFLALRLAAICYIPLSRFEVKPAANSASGTKTRETDPRRTRAAEAPRHWREFGHEMPLFNISGDKGLDILGVA